MSRALLILNSRQDRDKACAHCGAVFQRDKRNTLAYWERAKYCSHSCSANAAAKARAITLEQAFWTHVEKGDHCWEWTGLRDKDGYGLLPHNAKQLRAHVVSLQIDGRPVPKGMYGCHHCDNPGCVRPSHLYVGTPKQNSDDAKKRGRMRIGKRSNLSEDDVRSIRDACGTHESIAKRYGLSRAAVSLIRERKTWRHVK